jgi:hypothetical protein
MQKKQNKNRSNNGNLGRLRNRRMLTEQPPMLEINVKARHIFRFTSSDSNQIAITAANLTTVCGNVATSATNVRSIATAVKVNAIRIWSAPSAQGTSTTCSVNWFGDQFSPNKLMSDTSVSVSKPAKILARPPPKSLASFWQNNTAGAIFDIVAPEGSVIDIDMSFFLNDNNVSPTSTTVVGKTIGNIYYGALDGTFTTTTYPPVNLPN